MIEVHLKIFGTVQGVNFRYHAKKMAKALGLTGWVKNEDDGSVSVLAQGEKALLDEFIQWAKKGPDSARVTDVNIRFTDLSEGFQNFQVVH